MTVLTEAEINSACHGPLATAAEMKILRRATKAQPRERVYLGVSECFCVACMICLSEVEGIEGLSCEKQLNKMDHSKIQFSVTHIVCSYGQKEILETVCYCFCFL